MTGGPAARRSTAAGKLADRLMVRKGYQVTFTALQRTGWEDTSPVEQRDFTVTVTHPKFALRMLPPSGEIRLSAAFDSRAAGDGLKFSGLYKADLSRSLTDAGALSGKVFGYAPPEYGGPALDDEAKAALMAVDLLSVKSLVMNYVAPVLSSEYSAGLLVSAFTSGLTNERLASGMWLDEISGAYRAQYTNYIKSPLSSLTNGLVKSGAPLSAYTGTMADLLENHISPDGVVSLAGLGLKNPNDVPVKYCSLVVSGLRLYFRANILIGEGRGSDGSYSRTFPYDPSYRGFVFRLEIAGEDGATVMTLYSRTIRGDGDTYSHGFDVIGLPDGFYTFRVLHLGGITVHSERRYVWDGKDIDLIIDESCFIPNVVSGLIRWNGAAPVNTVHVRVESLDHGAVYYGEQYNGHIENGYYTPYYYNISDFCHQNSYSGGPSPSGTANWLEPSWPASGDGRTSINGGGRACYGSGGTHALGEYRLYDLIPGRYRLTYYVMPDTRLVDASADYDAYKWRRLGDSYFSYSLFDSSLDNGESQEGYWDEATQQYVHADPAFADISGVISARAFDVPLSAVQWQGGQKAMCDEYAAHEEWNVMSVLLFFSMEYSALDSHHREHTVTVSGDSVSSQERLNRRSLSFTSVREGDHFRVSLTNSDGFFAFGLDNTNLKSLRYHSIRVLFGEKAGEQEVDVTEATSEVPTVDVSRMYVRRVELIGENYDVPAYRQYKSLKLLSGGAEMPSVAMTKTEGVLDYTYDYTRWRTVYYGVEAGKEYGYSFGLKFGGQTRSLATGSLAADSTAISRRVAARGLCTLNLTVKDRAVASNGLPGYVRRGLYAWAFFSAPAPSAYWFSSLPDNRGDSLDPLTFSMLFDEAYSVGLYARNFSDGYSGYGIVDLINSVPSSEWKYHTFTTSSLTSGIVQGRVMSPGENDVTVYVPYQHLKVSLKGWNVKNGVQEPPRGKLTMARSQGDGNDVTVQASDGTAVRSGLYGEVRYRATYANSADTYEIRYEPMVMDRDRRFTIYSEIDVGTVSFTLLDNGTACPGGKLYLYDSDMNLFRTLTADSAGKVTESLPFIPFRLQGLSKANGVSEAKSFEGGRGYAFDATALTVSPV